MNEPLAERLRPKTLADFMSQSHLVGKKGALTQHNKKGLIPSMIFWGPPGTGKTTLANIIANTSERPFYSLSAISSGVKDVREIINKAKQSGGLFTTKNPILFIDEIHRFSKSQQDSLLQAVEKGWVTLIGATTENPSFEVIPALLSRCQVYILNSFDKKDLEALLKRAIEKDELISKKNIKLKETEALLRLSGGDARKLLNIFELIVNSNNSKKIIITNESVLQKVQNNTVRYDKTGEQHYDIISAFIKSVRGSDPNGAIYWLARMLDGGEDIKFIARRLIILASEDIGNADPRAMQIAISAWDCFTRIGPAEGERAIAQAIVYLACAPKSNAVYTAWKQALSDAQNQPDYEVPPHLRNAPTGLMKDLGYDDGYRYAHDEPGAYAAGENYLPPEMAETRYYQPSNRGLEGKIRDKLERLADLDAKSPQKRYQK